MWTLLLGVGTIIVSGPDCDALTTEWSEARDSNFEENFTGWDDWKLSHFTPILYQSEALTCRDRQDFAAWSGGIRAQVRAFRPPIYLMNLVLKLDC